MKMFQILTVIITIIILISIDVYAQNPDSMFLSHIDAAPGDTAVMTLHLRNTQFRVAGFTSRFIIENTSNAVFTEIVRGSDVSNFEAFNVNMSDSTCSIVGIANVPGGANPPPLDIGIHELARIYIAIDDNVQPGSIDSVFFRNDTLPPIEDNSVSDTTGYILDFPTLMNGSIRYTATGGIETGFQELPDDFQLSQNYPNPFNAETTIEFYFPRDVTGAELSVYNILGEEVRSFPLGHIQAGAHKIVWDGKSNKNGNLSSGVYFYRLNYIDGLSETRRMVLIK